MAAQLEKINACSVVICTGSRPRVSTNNAAANVPDETNMKRAWRATCAGLAVAATNASEMPLSDRIGR
jgi:hypothetical protein